MKIALDNRYNEVDRFITDASSSAVPLQSQIHLFRFGTVLICGYIERSIETIIMDRLSNRAHPRVLNFVKSHFQRGRNLDCSAISQLLGRFEVEWYRKFQSSVEQNDAMKQSIISCYNLRNAVAHGQTASVSLQKLQILLGHSKNLVDTVVECTK